MDESARRKWQARYSSADYEPHTEAEPLLREGAAQWKKGEALCLAAGAGRNAVFLAECGFAVTAVDISEHGLERCRQLANERGVEVGTVEADLLDWDMGVERYDLIVDFYYYEPLLFARVKRALRPGGLFVFQTFSTSQADLATGPSNRKFLVPPNRLLADFSDLRVRYYEDALVGSEALVRFVAEKEVTIDPL
ncbi:MAG: tellurite methyltransferase [Candidatus Latescibacterota bacterium]|jgi:tellurite methyltransferase